MSKRLIKFLSVGLGILLMMGLIGSFALAGKKELTLLEFVRLSPEGKKEYRNVVIRVRHNEFNYWRYDQALDKQVWENNLECIADAGYVHLAHSLMRIATFEMDHPRIKVVIDTQAYPDIMVALAGGVAPAYYTADGLPGTIEQGIYADITDLIKKWDRASEIPMGLWQTAWKDGRCYARPVGGSWTAGIVEIRKDWMEEAGVFNKYGEPLPEDNWTFSDFREIAKKLTDPKKKRYGLGYSTFGSEESRDLGRNKAYGQHYFVPDKTGKYTWRFNTDPVIAETLKWLGDMVFKDKSVLVSPGEKGFSPHGVFKTSRIGMYISNLDLMMEIGSRDTFSPTITRNYFSGGALYPQGPYGIRRGVPTMGMCGFNPTLSKEQLEATFEWINWNVYGRGRKMEFFFKLEVAEIWKQPFNPVWGWACPIFEPKWEISGLSDYISKCKFFLPDYLRKQELCWKIPEEPLPSMYGVDAEWSKDYDEAIRAMYSLAISEPNCDYQAVVNETAEFINKTCWNYKIKDDEEKLKEYYTALGEFYKEHYAEFYEKEWPNLLEKYKVW